MKSILRSLVTTPLLEEQEQQIVQAFLKLSEPLTIEQPLPEEFAQAVEAVMAATNSALKRAEQRSFSLEQEVQVRRQRAEILHKEIAQLSQQGAAIPYPSHVVFLREQLESVIGRSPDILCEQLEIPDERWQNAVEAMLGERRFTILVPPKEYKHVLTYIERHRAEARLHDASVLNLERAYKERRSAQRNSLAMQVKTNEPFLRAYIDSILGNIITCSSAQELERYQRAITPELLYYSE